MDTQLCIYGRGIMLATLKDFRLWEAQVILLLLIYLSPRRIMIRIFYLKKIALGFKFFELVWEGDKILS